MFMGTSKIMRQVFTTVYKVASTEANVLILGENGTGKELIAREIHRRSARSEEVFVSVDLGSITETLFESEMFGHVKGAFTDAKEDRVGRFEAASGGTLFLDEIGNLPISLQAKLLAALQNRKISKVGSSKIIPVNIRLICATNKNILDMVNNGLFRDDLLYRINTIQIEIPPLQHRKEDIPGLADYFLKYFVTKYEKFNLKISNDGYKTLLDYDWPGNVRELKHTLEKAVILADSDILRPTDFYLTRLKGPKGISQSSMKLADIEAMTIIEALKACDGNVTKAAKMLDISRTTLYTKIEKYNLLSD
jgi:DNA-binding NtrC family response regulator